HRRSSLLPYTTFFRSPSLSVTVAVSVIRLSADRLTPSLVSGSLAVPWITARLWSSVTSPLAATLTVNTVLAPVTPARFVAVEPVVGESTLLNLSHRHI